MLHRDRHEAHDRRCGGVDRARRHDRSHGRRSASSGPTTAPRTDPGAIAAAQRDVVLRPDDRADRRLPNDAPVAQPTTAEGFDWVDAGIGAAATLGLVLLVAGASVMRLRQQTQTA